jgi:hypothetical protein
LEIEAHFVWFYVEASQQGVQGCQMGYFQTKNPNLGKF